MKNILMKTFSIIASRKYAIKNCFKMMAGFLLISMIFTSCKKQTSFDGPLYFIKVFNGLDDGINLYRNFNGSRPVSFNDAGLLFNKRTALQSTFLEQAVIGSFFASPDTLLKDQPVLRQEFNLSASTINTLYVMGSKTDVDFLYTTPALKRYTEGDSVSYVTFVNICNDQPVSINIKEKEDGSLVAHLPYKAVSELIELPVKIDVKQYDIEFRDANTGDSLTTFILNNNNPGLSYPNTYLYKNVSIVLTGKRGIISGTNKLEAIRLNHD